jgi:hypothetical protein
MMYNFVFPTESRDVTRSDIGKIETEKPVAVWQGPLKSLGFLCRSEIQDGCHHRS